jgi:DNA-binding Lrp family transcriptional regulator
MAFEIRKPLTLDDVDRRIIGALVNDGRLSMRAVAEKVHISRANAYSRVSRMQEQGVIEGFSARVSYPRAGMNASAFVALSVRQNAWRGLAQQLERLAFVESFTMLGGELDVLVLVRAPNNVGLRDLVLEELALLDGVLSTKTWLIFEELRGLGPTWT